MEMLPDEEVKKIVAECGDNPDSVKESKKKFSEKSDAVKKDKRRAKKLKKQSKKKTVEPEKGDAGTCPDYRNNGRFDSRVMFITLYCCILKECRLHNIYLWKTVDKGCEDPHSGFAMFAKKKLKL